VPKDFDEKFTYIEDSLEDYCRQFRQAIMKEDIEVINRLVAMIWECTLIRREMGEKYPSLKDFIPSWLYQHSNRYPAAYCIRFVNAVDNAVQKKKDKRLAR
jgi:hypothetical protein